MSFLKYVTMLSYRLALVVPDIKKMIEIYFEIHDVVKLQFGASGFK